MGKKRINVVLKNFSEAPIGTPKFKKASRVLVKIAPKIEDQQLQRSILDMNRIKMKEGIKSPKLKVHVEGLKQQFSVRLRDNKISMPTQSNGGKISVKVESKRDILLGNDSER